MRPRAATNCDLYVLSKKSLDETVKYYPDICKQIKKAAETKREQLLQRTMDMSKVQKNVSATDILMNDTGCKLAGITSEMLLYSCVDEIESPAKANLCNFYNYCICTEAPYHTFLNCPQKCFGANIYFIFFNLSRKKLCLALWCSIAAANIFIIIVAFMGCTIYTWAVCFVHQI